MDVHHLDQRIAGEGIAGEAIALLGGGEAVVAVADGKEELVVLVGDERFQRILNTGDRFVAEEPAVDMTAALHQLKAVGLLQLSLFFGKGLDDGASGIVDQQQDMGHLQRRILADLNTRGNTLEHSRLCRADRRGRSLAIVIVLEIDDADDAAPDRVVGFALDIDHAVFV